MPYIDTRLGPGLADLAYTVGREFLGGRQREEAQRQRDLMDLLRQTQATSTPTWQDQPTQEPTGRFQTGPSLGESQSGQGSLANQMSWTAPDTAGLYDPTRVNRAEPDPRQRPGASLTDYQATTPYTPPYGSVLDPSVKPSAMTDLTAQQLAQPADPYARREPIERVPILGAVNAPQAETAPVTRRVSGPPEYTPGRSIMDVVAQNPRLLEYFKQYPGLYPMIQAESERQQWASGFGGGGDTGRAASLPPAGVLPTQAVGVAPVGTPGTAPSVATGTAQAALPEQNASDAATARRRQLQPRMDWINADPSGQRAALPQAKAFSAQFEKAVQDERETANALRQAQKAQREAQAPPPSQFAADYARAQDELRTELRREPTPTEIGVRLRAIGAKAAQPVIIDGQPYQPTVDPKTGETTGYTKVPGIPAKEEATKAPTEMAAAMAQADEELTQELGRPPTAGERSKRALAIHAAAAPGAQRLTEDVYSQIHDTGIDPRTGQPASPELRALAKQSVAGRQGRALEFARAQGLARADVELDQPIRQNAEHYVNPQGVPPPPDMKTRDVLANYLQVSENERKTLLQVATVGPLFEPTRVQTFQPLFPSPIAELNKRYQDAIHRGIPMPGILSMDDIKRLAPLLAEFNSFQSGGTQLARALGESGNVATADVDRVTSGLTGANTWEQFQGTAAMLLNRVNTSRNWILQNRRPGVQPVPAPYFPGGALYGQGGTRIEVPHGPVGAPVPSPALPPGGRALLERHR
jgi:hypothetical protein